MEKTYYCPTCNGELEMLSGCGAVGYFCNHCKKLVSRQKMLAETGEPQNQEKATASPKASNPDKSSESDR